MELTESRNYQRNAKITKLLQKKTTITALLQTGYNQGFITERPLLLNNHKMATLTELSQRGYNYGAITERKQLRGEL